MYDRNEPLFPFGFGLTYTTFEYSDIKTGRNAIRMGEEINVTFSIKNTGKFDSDEVTQMYISFPDSKVEMPALALKGFKRLKYH